MQFKTDQGTEYLDRNLAALVRNISSLTANFGN
jgi:hypothetical protein